MELHFFHEIEPNKNSTFVAFFSDGSGASLFKRDQNGDYYFSDGEKIERDYHWFIDSSYLEFAYMPRNFEIFFENRDRA